MNPSDIVYETVQENLGEMSHGYSISTMFECKQFFMFTLCHVLYLLSAGDPIASPRKASGLKKEDDVVNEE
ncbi:hypothetical protein GOP47_0017324 [Adiantum capillus-veneris]|uniref:Uncharacterized protein n=1 Tax=Adiantum capillus-veneris TaxID=13818 RepID=A0A9D4UGD8_ADICA|nr:hypothetical protein GOP47_0017324 [Adiantum capillus-veneris]